jgi:hypothetical protein
MKKIGVRDSLLKKKNAQSNIIVIVLIILIVLILLVILWNIIMGLLKQNQKMIELDRKISSININIEPPNGNWWVPSAGWISLNLTRGTEKLVAGPDIHTTITTGTPADIITVVDISGSMSKSVVSSCVNAYINTVDGVDQPITRAEYCDLILHPENTGKYCCYNDPFTGPVDCNDPADCYKVNRGKMGIDAVTGQNVCLSISYFPPSCFDGAGNPIDPTNEANCVKCIDSFGFSPNRYYWGYDCNFQIFNKKVFHGNLCYVDENTCENACGGEFLMLGTPESGQRKYCIANSTSTSSADYSGCCAHTIDGCSSEATCNSCFKPASAPPALRTNFRGGWFINENGVGQCNITSYHNLDCIVHGNNADGLNLCNKDSAICDSAPEKDHNNLDIDGSPYGRCVWNSGSLIPYGSTSSPCNSTGQYNPQGLGVEYAVCEGAFCRGEYRAIRRINYAKNANLEFINKVFLLSPGNNKVGIIDFTNTPIPHKSSTTNLFSDSVATDNAEINNIINSWIPLLEPQKHAYNLNYGALTLQKTNICKALQEAQNMLSTSADDRYKVIVLLTDGISIINCAGIEAITNAQKTNVRSELVTVAQNIHKGADNDVTITADNIFIYTIGIIDSTDSENAIAMTNLQEIASAGGGLFKSSANINDLKSLYDEIAFSINDATIKTYTPETNWNALKAIVYGYDPAHNPKTFTTPISQSINPLETREVVIPIGDLIDIYKIEIYLVASDGDTEVTKLLSTITR